MDKFSFDIDIEPFKEGVRLEINDFTADVLDEMFRKIVNRTPVKTGYAKSRWEVDIGKDAEGFVSGEITNDAPYIVYLEQGSSDQAPYGMIQVTLAEMEIKYS